ncbi:MAG: hypothetical protein PSV35_00825, partial [bacterium]|nr:hypothetical protein [bacterium]
MSLLFQSKTKIRYFLSIHALFSSVYAPIKYGNIDLFKSGLSMYQKAIVRTPSSSLINGLTTSAALGKPNYELALIQHQNYISALSQCNLEVTILPALESYPDSCFVEDVALLTAKMALLTRPGATSRQGEVDEIEPHIKPFYKHNIGKITNPGT